MEGFRSGLKELEKSEDEVYLDLKRGVLDEVGYKRQLTRIRSERQRFTTLFGSGDKDAHLLTDFYLTNIIIELFRSNGIIKILIR